jgi:hypothetical protein
MQKCSPWISKAKVQKSSARNEAFAGNISPLRKCSAPDLGGQKPEVAGVPGAAGRGALVWGLAGLPTLLAFIVIDVLWLIFECVVYVTRMTWRLSLLFWLSPLWLFHSCGRSRSTLIIPSMASSRDGSPWTF